MGGRPWEFLRTVTKSLGGRAHLCEAVLDNYLGPPRSDYPRVGWGDGCTFEQVRLGDEILERVCEEEKAVVNGLLAGLGVVICLGDTRVLSQVDIGPFHKLGKLGLDKGTKLVHLCFRPMLRVLF